MIFTQRLFTLLLGVLFASVLTDQASALYDPGVGRFCSRDPIGYEGRQLNIYEFVDASPLVSLDPSGKRKVCCKNRFMGIVEMECADGNTARECCSDLVIEAVDAPCERRQNCWKSGSAKVAGCSLIVAAPTDPSDVIGTPVGLCVAGGATLVWLCCASEILELPKIELPRIPLPPVPRPEPTPKKPRLGPDLPPLIDRKKNTHKCTTKARGWNKGTPCYEEIFTGFGSTEQEAKDAAESACQGAGCHQPGRGGDCGHTTCTRLP